MVDAGMTLEHTIRGRYKEEEFTADVAQYSTVQTQSYAT